MAASGLLGLHIGDIRHSRVIEPSCLSPVAWHSSGSPPVLEPGEVVLAAKGERNLAAIFTDQSALVIPSSQFLILRVKNEREMLSSFLCWILNYESTQKRLTEFHTGTNIPSLSKKALLNVTIPLPPIETQRAVLHLQSLWEEEKQITEALIQNREKMLNGTYQRILNGVEK